MLARRFNPAELALARSMRAQGATWRAIGDALVCEYTTIRQHVDPTFDATARKRTIVAKARERRATTRELRQQSNGGSCIGSSHPN